MTIYLVRIYNEDSCSHLGFYDSMLRAQAVRRRYIKKATTHYIPRRMRRKYHERCWRHQPKVCIDTWEINATERMWLYEMNKPKGWNDDNVSSMCAP